uniref:B30.2/SPRY domain-containing protein n=1 Tax=Oncorhynchus tshawytscha TaxID=74940 RepID=A0AAZ3NS56_ONCTS
MSNKLFSPPVLSIVFQILCLFPGVTAVTLNPDTAYPRLWVSPCCTQVSVGDIQPNLPNNPERFTRYNIVLGSQALASGQHYWVVEVGTKTAWGLGVATASVNRKDEISLWIGVYLDYGRGVVAFYDAGDMSHLFTFSDATFTEPHLKHDILSLTNGHGQRLK